MSSPAEAAKTTSVTGIVIFTILIVGTIIIIIALTKLPESERSWMIAGETIAAVIGVGSLIGLGVSIAGEVKAKEALESLGNRFGNWFGPSNSPNNDMYTPFAST